MEVSLIQGCPLAVEVVIFVIIMVAQNLSTTTYFWIQLGKSQYSTAFPQLKNKYGDAFIRGNNGKLTVQSCLVLRSCIHCMSCTFSIVLYISTTRRR